MKTSSSHRGSALLIVLGLLSFIVVSAVAFATYMRYSRLPSSYLRRTSASRLLAKAALAEAIEIIDVSIGDNPYPGVGTAKGYLPRKDNTDGSAKNRNYWRDRVFLGWDPNDGTGEASVDKSDTVATLSVEGLAYLPPPFINDVRYWSRYSIGGIWHNLAFDSGRFAFTAVDVSDCFDINRLEAAAGRDSSDLGRITLAHCFKKSNGEVDISKAESWDKFMANYIDRSGTKVPLVSMADWNLVINDKKPNGITSPFIEHFVNNAKFVTSETGPDAEMLRNMAFITESYSAGTNGVDYLDITDIDNQPQFAADAEGDSERENEDGLSEIVNVSSDKFIKHLTSQGVSVSRILPAALYDYLDRDSVPCSLAVPTVERTPMITGLSLAPQMFNIEIKTKNKEIPGDLNPATGTPKEYTRIIVGELSLNTKIAGRLSVVYPFKNKHGTKQPKFKAQLAASIGFVNTEEFGTAANTPRVHQSLKPAVKPGDWPTGSTVKEQKLGNAKVPTSILLVSEMKDIQLKTPVETEDDAIPADLTFEFKDTKDIKFSAAFEGLTLLPANETVDSGTFALVEKLDGNKAVVNSQFKSNFAALNYDWSQVVNNGEEGSFFPVIKLWARIIDENNKVVDLVPACIDDDEKPFAALKSVMKGSANSSGFLFLMPNGELANNSLTVSADALRGAVQDPVVGSLQALTPLGYITGDPRYNYAAENWIFFYEGGESLGKKWLESNRELIDSGDGDIFMATSDASYLQSVYELAHLPDVSGAGKFANDMSALNNGYDGRLRTGFQGAPAGRAMWQTLCTPEAFAQMRQMKVTSGTKGFRVNPNTRDVNIMMAALANSPMDWWAASTNDTVKGNLITDSKIDPDRGVLDFKKNEKYMFCENGEYMSVENKKLVELANHFMQVFANAAVQNRSWDEAFDGLDWDTADRIDGIDLDTTLSSVDRTFLHGYWHECFDNRQQLFLIFLRAEPAMMGGSLGQTPPQLGGRVVALVWRDPNKPTPKQGASGRPGNPLPHRTRVLFYRQLD